MDNKGKTSEKITKWLLIGIGVLFLTVMLILPLVTVITEALAKRMESLRRCGDRRVHHQSTSPHCEGNTFRSDL